MKKNILAVFILIITIAMLVACNKSAEMSVEGSANLCDDENYSIVLNKISKSDRNYVAYFEIVNNSDTDITFDFTDFKTNSEGTINFDYEKELFLEKGDTAEYCITITGQKDSLEDISELTFNVVVTSDTVWDYTISLDGFGRHNITWELDAFEVAEHDKL